MYKLRQDFFGWLPIAGLTRGRKAIGGLGQSMIRTPLVCKRDREYHSHAQVALLMFEYSGYMFNIEPERGREGSKESLL